MGGTEQERRAAALCLDECADPVAGALRTELALELSEVRAGTVTWNQLS